MRHTALFLSVALGAFPAGAAAGTRAGLFDVDISLRPPPETCISHSSNGATETSVTVTCSSGSFVSIGAAAEPQSLGTLRYRHAQRLPVVEGIPSRYAEIGAVTVTSYRLVRANGTDYPGDVIEMLVDF